MPNSVTDAGPSAAHLDTIVELSRALGEPTRAMVILAEGNTSLRTRPEAMLVKATGASMATASADDFVEVDLAQFDALINDPDAGDDDVKDVFARATVWGTGRPSVESLLHAVCQRLPGVTVAGHTHPIAVNGLLCSGQAELLVRGALFPDQIVVLGTNPLLLEYDDPGLTLARIADRRLREHLERTGRPPKVIYLANHGMFAVGASALEVLQITTMAVKVASILLGTLALGGPVYLSQAHVDRIDSRPDEELRRRLLLREPPQPPVQKQTQRQTG